MGSVHVGLLVVTVTVLVAVLTDVVVLVTVLLDGCWVVVSGAWEVVGATSVAVVVAVGDSVTVSVVPLVAGAPELAVLATEDVAEVPAGLVPPPLPVNFTTA